MMSMKKVRVQFEIPEKNLKKIEALMEEAGIQTKRELFNEALSLYAWAAKVKKDGRIVASVDEEQGQYNEVTLPSLDALTPIERPNVALVSR